jgi:3-phytase
VVVTGKDSHDLRVFDGATGATLDPIGGPGEALGSFRRPNAVLVVEDYGFVVERDNRRVQVVALPSGRPLGAFGSDELELPYGVVLSGSLPELTFWITDDYAVADSTAPDYTRRVHRYVVRIDEAGAPHVVDHATFGEASGEGALQVVESIGLDPELGRVLVADELKRSYQIYDTAGSYTGEALGAGAIQGDPEGIALVECPGGEGYWLVTDQRDEVSIFLLFDRRNLEPAGAFRGRVTANTDGITFAHGPVPGFPGGVMYAVHDDQALTAFAWDDVQSALRLRPGCGVSS